MGYDKEGLACSRLLDEVDFDGALIVFPSDLADDVGLSNLPCSLDEQTFFTSACSPLAYRIGHLATQLGPPCLQLADSPRYFCCELQLFQNVSVITAFQSESDAAFPGQVGDG